jgi:hypothetical protein
MSATPPESSSPVHAAKESDKFIPGGIKKTEKVEIQLKTIKETSHSHHSHKATSSHSHRAHGDSFDGADHSINEAGGEGDSFMKAHTFKISFYSWLTLDWVYQLIVYYRVDPSKSKGKHLI